MKFCKYVAKRATADELFNIIGSYLAEQGIEWENCLAVCTDGAQSMAGETNGLRALIMRVSPKPQGTRSIVHREALAARQMSPEPNTVLTDVINTVDFIKTRPLKARLFSALCEVMGVQH